MAHDGQDMTIDTALLPNLLTLTGQAIAPVEALLEAARAAVRDRVTDGGKVSPVLLDQNQTAAHGLAWLATYVEALRQMQGWAERLQAEGRFGEIEQLMHQIAFGEYLAQIAGGIPMSQGEIVRLRDMGLPPETPARAGRSGGRGADPGRQQPGRPRAAGGADAGQCGPRDRRCLGP